MRMIPFLNRARLLYKPLHIYSLFHKISLLALPQHMEIFLEKSSLICVHENTRQHYSLFIARGSHCTILILQIWYFMYWLMRHYERFKTYVYDIVYSMRALSRNLVFLPSSRYFIWFHLRDEIYRAWNWMQGLILTVYLIFSAKQDFKIQNIVGSCDVKFPIRLEGLAYAHGHFSSVSSMMCIYRRVVICKDKMCLPLFWMEK